MPAWLVLGPALTALSRQVPSNERLRQEYRAMATEGSGTFLVSNLMLFVGDFAKLASQRARIAADTVGALADAAAEAKVAAEAKAAATEEEAAREGAVQAMEVELCKHASSPCAHA